MRRTPQQIAVRKSDVAAIRKALARYADIAGGRSAKDFQDAIRAIDALARLTKAAGRPRALKGTHREWDADLDLERNVAAAMRTRKVFKGVLDLETATEALAAVEHHAQRALGRPLTRDERKRLKALVMRPKVERREIYEQVMSWRTGYTLRQVRHFTRAGIEKFRGA